MSVNYGMYYHRSSEAMPNEMCRPFLQEHVPRHVAGAWNAMWTDMMSDDRTNFMRYGKGPRGLSGTQSNPTNGKVQDRVDKAVTLTIRKVQ